VLQVDTASYGVHVLDLWEPVRIVGVSAVPVLQSCSPFHTGYCFDPSGMLCFIT